MDDPALQDIPFASASFGAPLEVAQVYTYPFVAGEAVDPANAEGCNAWPAGAFTGKAALISRGTCEFGVKVLNAEQAGAEFVVVYNHADGGDDLISMGAGAVGDQVTIPSVFVGHTAGIAMVAWTQEHGDAAELTLDTNAFQAGNTADRVIGFSSRGPGVGNVLKPDIAAPGVNILAQGYDPQATGEARHLGYGQVSGTSMASPHVAGSAALLRQIHPEWSVADIKSALMSTAKYTDIYLASDEGEPLVAAQPLDIGAGRLDLTNAADPGVILDPPSLSFGLVTTGTMPSITVTVRSVADTSETYELSTLYTGDGFTMTSDLPGFAVSPTSVTLEPGETAEVVVTFDSMTGQGMGDNQGYVIMDGAEHDAHMPAWARVTFAEAPAEILILDNDGSATLGFPDYASYYTSTLDALGYTYTYRDLDGEAAAQDFPEDLLETVDLLPYRAIVYFTGDNFYPNGSFSVPTPLAQSDMFALNEYANNGGTIIATGQDLASVMASAATNSNEFLYNAVLGGNWLQDAINQQVVTPTLEVMSTGALPLEDVTLDLSAENGDGADNQLYIDEIAPLPFNFAPGDPSAFDYIPTLEMDSADAVDEGIVAMAHRDQPTLETPGKSYLGRSMYFAFGLEGVNNDTGFTTREELLDRSLMFGWDEPEVTLEAVADGNVVSFDASFSSNLEGVTAVSYRFDYGDGSEYEGPYSSGQINHEYENCTNDTVARVEVVDSLGNHAVGTVSGFCEATAVSLGGIDAAGASGLNSLWLMALVAVGAGTLALWSRRRAA
ncbi:MAG: S8 family serine peptidase [Geodermatophilaceae bacterium]|nr:S8 family serine peptidase [Geodermatophilaceae bacterium]